MAAPENLSFPRYNNSSAPDNTVSPPPDSNALPPPPGGIAVPCPPPPPLHENIPPCVSIFGAAPLLEGEDSRAYDELLARISALVKPNDIFEDILVRDIVDRQWEINQLRHVKSYLPTAALQRALIETLSPLVNTNWDTSSEYPIITTADALVRDWYLRDQMAVEKVKDLLSRSPKMTMETVSARAFANELPSLVRINHLISAAEAGRNASWREIERHRSTVAKTPRGAPRD